MQYGILSRNQVRERRINFSDISEQGVQDRRSGKKVPGTNMELHDYVNFYFDAHNPMLSARRSENDTICVLRINGDVIDLRNVIVTDRNAARDCWFKSVEEGLALLDKSEVYATFWTHSDYFEQERLKGIKCAEVLIPEQVSAEFILGAYVANQASLSYFESVSNLSVSIKRGLFF